LFVYCNQLPWSENHKNKMAELRDFGLGDGIFF